MEQTAVVKKAITEMDSPIVICVSYTMKH